MKWQIPSDAEVRESKPIPVLTAMAVSDSFGKAIVVIAAFDDSAVLQVATFGRTEEDKHQAARLGPIVARAMGAEPALGISHEDFRADRVEQATRARIVSYLRHTASVEVGSILTKDDRMIVDWCASWIENRLDERRPEKPTENGVPVLLEPEAEIAPRREQRTDEKKRRIYIRPAGERAGRLFDDWQTAQEHIDSGESAAWPPSEPSWEVAFVMMTDSEVEALGEFHGW